MFVGEAGIALWIGGLLLIGFLGFFLVLVTLVFRLFGWVFRVLTGSSTGKHTIEPHADGSRRVVCPHAGCGHGNPPTALFCGRCGRPLRRTYDVDAYG